MGRNKAAKLRKAAEIHGWLDTELKLPDNKELSEVLEHTANLPQQLPFLLTKETDLLISRTP